MSDALANVRHEFEYWLHLPDPAPLYVVLATVVANRMAGDPIWTALVGPPGGGKTEIVQSIASLEEVHFASTLTEASLLSGTPSREKAKTATGGLLRQVGSYGIVVCKDFTSVLQMAKDSRGQVLAALREIFDGSWTRLVGTDGGRELHWRGKVGLVAGCTPTIDRHHAVMGAMGERFVLYRLPQADPDKMAASALDSVDDADRMRGLLRAVVADLFANLRLPAQPPRPSDEDRDKLVKLATLAARCRSAVERDSYRREIELIPDSEAPTRLIRVLGRMLASLRVLGVPDEEAWPITVSLGLDSMPAIRRAALDCLLASQQPMSTTDIAVACGYPTTTAQRALEDLEAHRICRHENRGKGYANDWSVTEWTRDRFAAIGASPESPDADSGALITPFPVKEGISGDAHRGVS